MEKLTFTAYLQDEYSKNFDRLAAKSDSAIKTIEKDLNKLSGTGKQAARSIEEINKRIDVLTRVKKMTIDTSAIKFANEEIKALQREKEKLDGGGTGGGFLGMGGNSFAIAGMASAAVAGVGAMAKGAISDAMEREQQRISFGVLVGSQQKGDKMLDDINQMAAATPMETNDLIQATQTMLSFGVAQEKVLPIMHQIGDISGGNKERFQSLSLAYAQMSSTGRLMGQDLLQMVNAGFNPLQIISEKTGKSMRVLKKEMEDGKISARMVTQAISDATSEGGKYFGMMDKQSQTTAGRLSTLRDSVHELSVSVGNRLKPSLDSGIDGLSKMVATVKSWVDIPLATKINDEITQIRLLQSELTNTNTSEQRRKEILEELEKINPRIVDGINAQNIEYGKLATNIDKVVGGLRQKLALDTLDKKNVDMLADRAKWTSMIDRQNADLKLALVQYAPDIANNTKMSDDEKFAAARQMFATKKAEWYKNNPDKQGAVSPYDKIETAFRAGLQNIAQAELGLSKTEKQNDAYLRVQKALNNSISQALDPDPKNKKADLPDETDDPKKKKKRDGEDVSGISGGSKITHINVSIQNLVNGGVNFHNTTVEHGARQAQDIVLNALLTAVNDSNLAGGK